MSRVLAVIAILSVVGFFIFYTQSPDIVTAAANQAFQPEWIGKTFSLGETIEILERPQFFPDLIDDVTLAMGFQEFTSDDLPQEYRDLAAEQRLAEGGDLLDLEAEAISGNLTKSQVVTQTDQHVKGDSKEAKLVNTGKIASVFTRGEIIPVVGKLDVPLRPAPYFYNLIIYCCENFDDAIVHYTESLRLDPEQANVHKNIAVVLVRQGEVNDGINHFKESLRFDPNQPEVYINLALALSQQKQMDEAIEQYEHALKLKPDNFFVLNNLGEIYFMREENEKAVGYFEKALELEAGKVSVLNNLAWLKAAYEKERFHEPKRAVELAQQACELTKFEKPSLLDTLSVAYAASGKFNEAIETAEKAIDLALSSKQNDIAKEIQNHLELYKSGQAYFQQP